MVTDCTWEFSIYRLSYGKNNRPTMNDQTTVPPYTYLQTYIYIHGQYICPLLLTNYEYSYANTTTTCAHKRRCTITIYSENTRNGTTTKKKTNQESRRGPTTVARRWPKPRHMEQSSLHPNNTRIRTSTTSTTATA